MTDTSNTEGMLQEISKVFGNLSLKAFLSALLLFLICYTAGRILRRIFGKLLNRTRLSENIKNVFKQFLRFLIDFIIILIIAEYLGIPVTSLFAVFSLLGLAISLSLQNLLSNLISGIVLLMSKPFVAGNYVAINGAEGTVKQVALFQTQLDTVDNKLIYIPNSDVVSSTITNYSAEGIRRLDLTFGASFDSASGQVKAALLDCASSVSGVLDDPAPVVLITGYGDSNVNYTLRLWAKSEDTVAVKEAITDRVLSYYEEYGVSMSYNRIVLEK